MNASMRTPRFLGLSAVAALLLTYKADHAVAAGHSQAVSGLAVVASAQEPAGKNQRDHGDHCGHDRQWSSAWGARGPLSTTITTKTTFNEAVPDLSGATVRIMAHLTAGGSQVRVRFSQRFSSVPLVVDSAHVAIRKAS